MKFEEAKEMIVKKIIEVYEKSLRAHNENYFSVYITPDGEMYEQEEVDRKTIPEPVFNGKHKLVCQFKGCNSVLPDNKEERDEIIRETGSEEAAEDWIIPDIIAEYENKYLVEVHGDLIEELASWISE